MDLKETLKNLPPTPGVYIMKDARGSVLYVGKAKNLKKRVSSYFQRGRGHPARLEMLVSEVEDISYLLASTEAEALIYENSLIKQLDPKYNVALKDDKSYPMFKLTVNEKFPRIYITRKKENDGALYFGPYSDAKLLRSALSMLKHLFPLRTCVNMPKRVCLNYHIRQCPGPCESKVSEAAYNDTVRELRLFLDGKKTELIKFLAQKMAEASREEKFEYAAELKRRMDTLSAIKEKTVKYGPMNDVEELKNMIGLEKMPMVIEAFDVSNTMGKEAVGSMISFNKGRPDKSNYRRFRIKTVASIDDYGMIRELVNRRYSRAASEGRPLPDLVLIDGGRGHLNVALDELKKIGLGNLPVISIAKEFEHIFTVGKKAPIVLPKESKALHLIERIRDEAHRFAITYHKKLLSKNIELSVLDNIPRIGRKRKRALISALGSIENIKSAGLDQLMRIEGIDERSAKNIVDYFRR